MTARVRGLGSLAGDLARARRGGAFGEAERKVAARILADVRRRGDAAVLASVRRFDRRDAAERDLAADRRALRRAARACPREVRAALEAAYRRIRAFHALQRPRALERRDDGAVLRLEPVPLTRVGALVPRGTVGYPSTALMTGVPAQLAGVGELVIASPMTSTGALDPALAYAALLVDASLLFRAGGAAAVAALAYGTARCPRVDKVVGPGNAYAAAAKWLVSAEVGIDALQGPSELVAVASADADPGALVLDLCAQAEHGAGAVAALLSDDAALLAAVALALRQLGVSGIRCYRSRTVALAVAAANEAAPEHVLLAGRRASALARRVTRAGAVFVGGRSAVAFGDYVAGSNHCLPTGGTARWSSVLRVDDFVRWTSRVALDRDLRRLARQGAIVARYEGMPFHAASMEVRG